MAWVREFALSISARFFKGGVRLTLGYATQQAIVFVRNVMVARLLGPDDFGIAVTFAVAITSLELLTDVGVDKFIVHASDGDAPVLQKTLQTALLIRGALIACGVFLCAGLVAAAFQVPQAAWAYQWLALVPLIKGFMHLDPRRLHRSMDYSPDLVIVLIGSTVALIAAVCLALMLGTYEAMLWAYLIEAGILVLASHRVAERRYGLSLDVPAIRRLGRYGWPLVLNGVVLLLMSQGDRVLIGSKFGVRDLATYAVATILAGGPTLIVLKVTGALYLPLLSNPNGNSDIYSRRYELANTLTAVAAYTVMLPLIFLGSLLIELIYGQAYNSPALLVAWLAVAAGAKVLRSFPVAASLAAGTTHDIMVASILRVFGFAGAWYAVNNGHGAVGVAIGIALGEILAAGYASHCADRLLTSRQMNGIRQFLLFMLLTSVAMLLIHLLGDNPDPVRQGLVALALLIVSTGAAIVASPVARNMAVRAAQNAVRGNIRDIFNQGAT